MRVTITQDYIEVYVDDGELAFDPERGTEWSCRHATHEVAAWAIKRLGEELEKSVRFYRTGEATDNIGMG